MFRTLVYLLVTVFIIVFLRAVIGLIGKAVAQLFESESPGGAGSTSAGKASFGGELKKDPVCGVFVSAGTSLQKTVGGKVYHFCSSACREKFKGS